MVKSDKKLEDRAQMLSQLIINNSELYQASQEPEQRVLEIVIGDAVRHLPHTPELFSGKISLQAFEKMQSKTKDAKLLEFYIIPRTVLARLLFTKYLEELKKDPFSLISLYYGHLGKYHLILSEEVHVIRKLQRSPELAGEEKTLQNAGVEWMDFSYEAYQELKWRGRERARHHHVSKGKL